MSAYSVISNLPKDKYNAVLLGITKDGKWLLYEGDAEKIPTGEWINGKYLPCALSPDYGKKEILVFDSGAVRSIHIDVAFPVLHGKNGEDGTVQGLFELAGVPYVGCGVLSSAMCMDKYMTNTIADSLGVPQAKWLGITKSEYEKSKEAFAQKCLSYLGLPLFIKPANAGSSVGISKVKTEEDFYLAAETAFKEDKKIVAEEAIIGREAECSVIGNDEPLASVVGEILPKKEFYDYNAKYIDGDTELCIPADIPKETSEEIRRLAVKVYKALGCRGLSRVDFFIRSDGRVIFNEINTMPGFTSISMYSMLLAQSGIPYSEMLDRLIALAAEGK